MTNPKYSRLKGATFEIGILKLLRERGFKAERLRLAGKDDEGDIVVLVASDPVVFELKATAKMDLPQFWREAVVESANYAKARGLKSAPPAYVIVKRRSASLEDAWVIQSFDQWMELNDGK